MRVCQKWPINQFKPVHQSRPQTLRAYCPNIYTVFPGKVLATSPKEEGLINNRELSLLCGCIESRTVLDCDFAPNEACAVLVLTPGKVDVLKRKDEASDLLVKTETFSFDKPGTQLKVVKEKIFVIGQQVSTNYLPT